MKLDEILFPQRCVACGALLDKGVLGEALCEHCLAKWEIGKVSAAKAHKGQPTRIFTDAAGERCGSVMFLGFYEPQNYENVENRLLFSLKDRGGRRAVDFAARELAAMIRRNLPFLDGIRDGVLITWVPRRRSSVRASGFDHMERVAKRLSRYLSVSLKRLICRKLFAPEQKHLGANARRMNAHSTMKLANGVDLKGKTVLLIDDIVTTGASLEAAAELMMRAGAAQVIAAVLCATEHACVDEYRTENGFNIIKKRKK